MDKFGLKIWSRKIKLCKENNLKKTRQLNVWYPPCCLEIPHKLGKLSFGAKKCKQMPS